MSDGAWHRTPGQGKYARIEREHRYLLAAVPLEAGPPRVVEDLYVTGTSLRLRRVGDAATVVGKLTQKVRPVADDPTDVAITNLYLTEGELALLSTLPGDRLRKRRRSWLHGGQTWAVDEHEGRWSGLVLAELEADEAVEVSPPLLANVTRDERFTGGSLAAADDAAVAETLAWVRRITVA